MDPATMAALGSLGGMLGKGGGGGTKVSQSVTNNASAIISAIIQGTGQSPTTGTTSAPQSGAANSAASGSETTPSWSDASLGNGYDGIGAGDTVAPALTGYTMNQTWMYILGAVAAAGAAAFLFLRK